MDGELVTVEGLLNFEFENVSVDHWPKGEQRGGYESSIWIDAEEPIFAFDSNVMSRWYGKRVVVYGKVEFGTEVMGAGHMGIWPARIVARRIDLLKNWKAHHPEDFES